MPSEEDINKQMHPIENRRYQAAGYPQPSSCDYDHHLFQPILPYLDFNWCPRQSLATYDGPEVAGQPLSPWHIKRGLDHGEVCGYHCRVQNRLRFDLLIRSQAAVMCWRCRAAAMARFPEGITTCICLTDCGPDLSCRGCAREDRFVWASRNDDSYRTYFATQRPFTRPLSTRILTRTSRGPLRRERGPPIRVEPDQNLRI
jgi:hypothetical protein